MDVKIISLLFVLTMVRPSHEWSGHLCLRREVYYDVWIGCAYRTWFDCCYWRLYFVKRYKYVFHCCSGWKASPYNRYNCNIAICRPNCKNGGTCDRPGHCNCRSGYDGERCDGRLCSHLTACYPGSCDRDWSGTSTTCSCEDGFGGNRCIEMKRELAPSINAIQARMSFWLRGIDNPMEKYALMVDSTNKNGTDFIWTNRVMFNWINVTTVSQYVGDDPPPKPSWIKKAEFGIIKADVNIVLIKQSFQGGGQPIISKNETVKCNRTFTSMTIGPRSPAHDLLNCSISLPNFDRQLENADRLTVTFTTKSGGYRDVVDPKRRYRPFRTHYFKGQVTTKAVEFRFDTTLPEHCYLDDPISCTGNDDIFSVDNDIHTDESPIKLNWHGWTDNLSGMFRYAWEVFKLVPDISDRLHEHYPLQPLKIAEVIHANLSNSLPSYQPAEVGMYSFILEASDMANNSRFIRRLCLYDPSSEITLNTEGLEIVSAIRVGQDAWTSNISNPLVVSWKDHFVNKIHEDNKLLNSVKEYPQQLEDGLKIIHQDDIYGRRTVNAIDNSHGIVKFQVVHAKDSNAGEGQREPTTGWQDFNPLTHSTSVNPTNPSRGDTVTIWVRAFDITGRNKTDKVRVHFDDTPPSAGRRVYFKKNVESSYPFGSKVALEMSETESGIARVNMTIVRLKSASDMMTHSYTIPTIPKSECQDTIQDRCFCSTDKKDLCQKQEQILDINNCWLMVEKDGLKTESVELQFQIFNNALLYVTRTVTIIQHATLSKEEHYCVLSRTADSAFCRDTILFMVSNLMSLNGTEAFLGPMHIGNESVSSTSARITWDHSPACYERTEIWINYRTKEGKLIKKSLHKKAVYEDLTGLDPGTNYTVQLISQYGDVMSEPVNFILVTESLPDESTGLGGGAVAGIIIGLLILIVLVLLLVGFLLWRIGRLPKIVRRLSRYKWADHISIRNPVKDTKVKNVRKPVSSAIANNAYLPDDEIYLYGSMSFDSKQTWYVHPNDLTLVEHIHTGRFAKIFTATWKKAPKGQTDVIAKLIKDDHTEDDVLTMMAKINFAATQVGEHPNILRFLGAVVDNDELGPIMVLERCETGQLDQWLTKQQGKATDDTIEKMQRMSLEIAQAMAYLATRGIVHKKLAARNVLLTFILEVKVTGFGPTHGENKEEEDNSKGDRIPIKWTAPECLHAMKNADENSDVWSYGVVLWEIFSLGETPYPKMRSRDIEMKLKTGYRLGRPEFCEDIHFQMMQDCWEEKANKRPDFKNLVVKLESTFGMQPSSNDFYYYEKR